MKRQRLSRLHRTRIFDDAKGYCCICKGKVTPGQRWIVEHLIPLWLGGPDDDTNRRPAHERCAIEKTISEAPIKAKSDRVRANYLGIRKHGRKIRSRGFEKAPPQRSATRPIMRDVH